MLTFSLIRLGSFIPPLHGNSLSSQLRYVCFYLKEATMSIIMCLSVFCNINLHGIMISAGGQKASRDP